MPASKLATTAEAFDGTATEMAAEITRMAAEQKAARGTLFSQFTARIFEEFPNLNRVVVQGYTPGFNDGDPCTHSQQTYVSVSDFSDFHESDEEDSPVEYVSGLSENYRECYRLKEGADGFPFNTDLTAEELEQVRTAFDAFGEAIEDLYTTDFTLTWKRSNDDGKVTFAHDHYECGY